MSLSPVRAAALIVVAIFLAACGAVPQATPTPDAQETPPAATPTPTPEAEPTQTPLALVSEDVPGLRNNTVAFASVEYTILEAVVTSQDPRAYAENQPPEPTESFHVVLAMRGHSISPRGRRAETATEDFKLQLADGRELDAVSLFGRTTDFYAPAQGTTADGFLAFAVDADTDLNGAVLMIGRAPDRRAQLMLTDDQPEPGFPIELDVSGEARGVGVTNSGQILYTLLGAALHIDNPLDTFHGTTGDRANEDELFLVLDLRLLLESGRVEGTFKEQFRLIVDGAPREPWNFPRGDSIGPGASVDTEVGWLIPTGLSEVVLEVGKFDENPVQIPISLPPTD